MLVRQCTAQGCGRELPLAAEVDRAKRQPNGRHYLLPRGADHAISKKRNIEDYRTERSRRSNPGLQFLEQFALITLRIDRFSLQGGKLVCHLCGRECNGSCASVQACARNLRYTPRSLANYGTTANVERGQGWKSSAYYSSHIANSSSSVRACFRSSVSKPSVNQP